MKLPGFPTSKTAIIAKAGREDWYFEEKTGIGGTRRVYEIPTHYLPQNDGQEMPIAPESSVKPVQGKVIGTITPGGRNVDLETLKFVDTVLEEWLQQKGLRLKPERRAGVLAVLCDYLEKGATADDLREMLKVLSA